MSRRIIYIQNPSQGSHFRTINAERSPQPPRNNPPRSNPPRSGGTITPPTFANTHYWVDLGNGRGRWVRIGGQQNNTGTSQFVGVNVPNRPTPPQGPRPVGNFFGGADWLAVLRANFFDPNSNQWDLGGNTPSGADPMGFGGAWNWSNLWSERHVITPATGRSQGLTVYTPWGGDLPPGMQPGYQPNDPWEPVIEY